ncbi:MAG: undecaprenyl-phosphate glucose phosphotransferase [Phycisphaerae bacterium]|nr:MAG: undecaprenyl-phosphate glucose phosphotransferase [Phycisphaerae bacterium]
MLKQQHQLFVILLCIVDAMVIASACLVAWLLRKAILHSDVPDPTTLAGAGVWVRQSLMVPLVVLGLGSLWVFGLYKPRRDQALWAEQKQLLKAMVGAVLALVVVIWLVAGQEITRGASGLVQLGLGFGGASMTVEAGRIQLGLLAAIGTFMLCAERLSFRVALRAVRKRGWNLRHVCVIGVGRLGRICCRTLDRNSWTGIHVAYFISHNDHHKGPSEVLGRQVLGGLADLERVLDARRPDAVYLAIPSTRTAIRPQLLRRLERFCVSVRIVPDVHPRYMPHSVELSQVDGMPVMSIRENPLAGVGGAVKRLVDMVGAIVGLIVFMPVMLVIAVLVGLSGPGPIIFRQRRVSLGGEEFRILKFRTMEHAEDETSAAGWTSRDDPRVTRLGRFLRRTSLDELPQLFNVLVGEMSLVGPRPERPELIARFRDDWRGYMLRQHVKAGMTGWAQVNGLRGDTSLKKRLQHDLFYVRNWSLGFDLKILILTLLRGFIHPNAH